MLPLCSGCIRRRRRTLTAAPSRALKSSCAAWLSVEAFFRAPLYTLTGKRKACAQAVVDIANQRKNTMTKVALVTGASRGIGRATALLLARQGYAVGVNYLRDESAARQVVAEIEAQGIRVNGVRPGLIYTEIHASGGEPGRVDRVKSSLPMQRGGQPQEVAEAIAWLLSDAASYVTGTFIETAGGR
ncbi:SDR family oxidoreductase [Serratia ureilytica]|uniref:SDR family oxidoreductase n=2 Tax=Serratia TaxID=613 RepID=UPI00313F2694